MKLAEAILERNSLNMRLDTLASRLRDEDTPAGHRRHLLEEIQQASNQVRDLSIAIDWTETVNNLVSLPIKGHRHKIENNLRLSKIFEKADPDKSDELWRSAIDDLKVVEASTWLVDLQIPTAEGKAKEPHKEVD